MSDTQHCLRPTFTERLYRKLKEDQEKSVNLIARRGTGGGRLLRDLARLAAAEGLPVVYIDMNAYKTSPDAFAQEVSRQIHGPSLPPAGLPALNSAAGNAPLVSQVLAQKEGTPQRLFLLFDNFHKLLDNEGQRFGRRFFDDLNSLKGKAHIALCLVTEKSHLQYRIIAPDEQGSLKNNTSWLQLSLLELTPLSHEEIRAELARELGELPNWQAETQRERVVEALRGHEHPEELLALLKTNYEFEDGLSTDQRITQTMHSFGRNAGPRPHTRWWTVEGLLAMLKNLSEAYKNFKS